MLPGQEPLTKEVLTELYVNQRLGSVTIAAASEATPAGSCTRSSGWSIHRFRL